MLVRPARKRLFCLREKNELGRFALSALRFSGSSLIVSCLTVLFSCGIVYSLVKRTPESKKKNVRISHQTENHKENIASWYTYQVGMP